MFPEEMERKEKERKGKKSRDCELNVIGSVNVIKVVRHQDSVALGSNLCSKPIIGEMGCDQDLSIVRLRLIY